MKIKWGAAIVAGSGKAGGHVASRNRAGSYLRTKVTPVNPQTSYQTDARNRLASISSFWSSLYASDRRLWNEAVDSFKKTNVFGDIVKPSGFNLYQMLNNNLTLIGQSVIDVPPVPQALPTITTGVLAAVHDGAVTVTFTTDPVITACDLWWEATPALSPGKSFVKSEFRSIGLNSTITAHVVTLTTLYDAKFGVVGAAGKKLFVRVRMINQTTGQAGIPVVLSCIIS
jgi:hypothetical protein